MNNLVSFQAAHTTQGLPAFWEKRDEGQLLTIVELIADQNFKPKKPVFLNRKDNIKPKFHMLFVAEVGDVIIKAIKSNSTNRVTFTLFVIMDIRKIEDKTGNNKLKYEIFAEELFSSNLIDDFTSEYSDVIEPLMEAAYEKCSKKDVNSIYCLPHNLEERAIESNSTN